MKNIRKYLIVSLLGLIAGFAWSCTADKDSSDFEPLDPQMSFVSEPLLSVTKQGGDFAVGIKSNLPWRVKTDASWIVIDKESALGDGEFKFSVSRNRTVLPRQGEIVAWITDDYTKTFRVEQAASDASDLVTHYYVKADGKSSKDGLSWADATTLETAFDAMVAGDFIHIAAGTYTPTTIITGGSADKEGDKTFEVHSNVNIIGGYPANAAEGAVADHVANPTILSGGAMAYHVVVITAPVEENKRVSMRGLTITSGSAAVSGTGDVTINGATIYRFYGGGLVVGGSLAELTDCVITKNASGFHAAGVYVIAGANVMFDRCEISDNANTVNGTNGAGLFNDASTVILNHSVVSGNRCAGVGAGIYAFNANKPTYTYVFNSTVSGNNNNSTGLKDSRKGGGMYGREFSQTVVVNTTFEGNIAGLGGGISLYGTTAKASKMDLISCTFTNNTSYNGGGGVTITEATLSIHNTIISGNKADKGQADIDGKYSISNSIVGSGVYGSTGVLLSDKNFDAATMLDVLADNGGLTKTCKLLGVDNPAFTLGMQSFELVELGLGYVPTVGSEIMSVDQTGLSRADVNVIGACVRK